MKLVTKESIASMQQALRAEEARLLFELSLKQIVTGWLRQVEESLALVADESAVDQVALYLKICRLLEVGGASGELSASSQAMLVDAARLLLVRAGIRADDPQVGGVVAALDLALAVAARRSHQSWSYEGRLCLGETSLKTAVPDAASLLKLADLKLRDGNATLALADYETLLASEGDSTGKLVAAVGILRCLRLSGAGDAWAARGTEFERAFAGELTSRRLGLEWEMILGRAVADGRYQSLMLATGPKRPHRLLVPMLLTTLWRLALGDRTVGDSLPNERALRRLMRSDDVDTAAWADASALFEAFEGPMREGGGVDLPQLARLLDAACRGPDVEVELLTFAAVANRLASASGNAAAEAMFGKVKGHYHGLCRRLSATGDEDLYRVFVDPARAGAGDKQLATADLKAVSQMLLVGGFAVGSVKTAAGARLRRAFSSASASAAIRDREIEEHAARLREFLAYAKGPILKIAQAIAFAEAALPAKVAAELVRATTAAAPLDHRIAAKFVEQELRRPISELFAEWAPYPVATASLGQVHRARLLDGRQVAVKVQYPHVREQVERQMTALKYLAPMIALFFPRVKVKRVVDEALQMLAKECDYRLEATMQTRVASVLAGEPAIRVPKVIESHSTDRILTQEFIDGLRFYEFRRAVDANERAAAAQTIFKVHFGLRFQHGIINYDPHPGNFLFGDGYIALVDFGCYRPAEPDIDRGFLQLVDAARRADPEAITETLATLGFVGSRRDFDVAAAARYVIREMTPFVEDREYTFEDDYLSGNFAEIARNVSAWSVPERWLAHLRSGAGIASLLVQLNARGNWHRLFRSVLSPAATDDASGLRRVG